jgi:hypothetical protein
MLQRLARLFDTSSWRQQVSPGASGLYMDYRGSVFIHLYILLHFQLLPLYG